MDLFLEIYKWWAGISLVMVLFYVKLWKKDKEKAKKEFKFLCGFIVFMLVIFTFAYISRLNDKIEQQETLKFYIQDCLKKNRHLTYGKCEDRVIEYLNDKEPYIDSIPSPSYRY